MKKAFSLILALALVMSFCITASAKAPNYVVLGDSIGAGSGIVNPHEACYGRIVANTNKYNYANYAVDGATTSDLIIRLSDEPVAAAVKKADIINISIGGNNFIKSNLFPLMMTIPFGNMNVVNKIIDGVKSDFDTLFPKIKKMNPDAVIILQTLYNPWKMKGIAGVYQKGVDALNSCFREYLKKHPGEFVLAEVGAAFAAESADLIAVDTIHPNARGNKLIAKVILKKLYDLGLGKHKEPVIVAEPIDRVSTDMSNYIRMAAFYTGLFL